MVIAGAACFILMCLAINSCEERANRIEKIKEVDASKVAHDLGKEYRSIKDAFIKGYRDTTNKDTTSKTK
jgi:hypothetical protein